MKKRFRFSFANRNDTIMTNIQESIWQQATVGLLLAVLRATGPGKQTQLIDEWFQTFANELGFANPTGQSSVNKLRSFLSHIESQPSGIVSSQLASAIHEAIATLVHHQRFSDAIEEESRRQFYDFAYGLTHEINNPLGNIAARAQQLLSSASSDNDRKSLATIVDQAMRAHDMLAEMMQVAKPRTLELGCVDLSAAIHASVSHLQAKLEAQSIEVFVHPTSAALSVFSQRGPLEEAFVSILQNSVEACRPSDRIDIVSEKLLSGDPDAVELSDQGPQVRVAIRDTGKGLTHDAASRAFHLYYSGRESGRGLGISLAKARRVIEASGGKIWLKSHPNVGTTVEIRLLVAEPPPAPRKKLGLV